MFSVSQTTSYAFLALACLASRHEKWHLLRKMSQCTGVPVPYLSKVMGQLAEAGVVEGKRGYQGGYRLARPADQVSLMEVVQAIEGSLCIERCVLGMNTCSGERACHMHDYWVQARTELVQRLSTMTIEQMSRLERISLLSCKEPQGQVKGVRKRTTVSQGGRDGKKTS